MEQAWVKYLLALLLFLNAPWYGWTMTVKNWFLVFLCSVGQACFIAVLLLFWLILLDLVSQNEHSSPDFQTFYLAKTVFVFIGAVLMIAYDLWLTWYQYQDATADAESKLGGGYSALKYSLVIYIVIYAGWLSYYLCRACKDIMDLSQRMLSFLAFTILSMVGMLSCLLVQWNSGEEEYNAPVFVAFHALCNIYVYGLALFCQPVRPTRVNMAGLGAARAAPPRRTVVPVMGRTLSDVRADSFERRSLAYD